MYQILNCLITEHDWRLVALAGTVCFLASAVAISLFDRARSSQGRSRLIWLGLDATVAGCGIWATHFIAMLAYDPGTGAGYNIRVTILSLIFAVAVTGAGLGVALSDARKSFAAIGGVIVGIGVAAMHYTGMVALELPARIEWSWGIVLTSIVFGSVFGAWRCWSPHSATGRFAPCSRRALLTVAIVSHHFTGMGAVTLIPDPTIDIHGNAGFSGSAFVPGRKRRLRHPRRSLARRRHGPPRQGQRYASRKCCSTQRSRTCRRDCACSMRVASIVLFNERFTGMMGEMILAFRGKSLLDLLRHAKAAGEWDGDPDHFFAKLLAEAGGGKSVTRIFERRKRAIRMINQPMKGGGWVSTFEDITEWQRAQEQISHMARHDALTNLPNRTLFRERLERALQLAKRGDQLAVFCLDLDHFKEINDSLGHPVGDALLSAVASRLRTCLTDSDTVARLGGDEFAIVQLCANCEPTAVAALASQIVEIVAAPYDIESHHLVIGVSIGIALSPDDGDDPDELLKRADLALYRAKADGRGTYRFFETGMDARVQARRLMELDLRVALRREEFEVYYQPIRDLASDETAAFEALVRWNHGERGLIQPAQFIPIAEDTGLIVPLGEWVLRRACKDAAGWSKPASVAVNLSPVQFRNPNLVASVKSALADSRPAAASARAGNHGIGAAPEQRRRARSPDTNCGRMASRFRSTISAPAIRR